MQHQQIHVLFATSEISPWSQTGGLADVCGALPKALDQLTIPETGEKAYRVSIVTPYYRCVKTWFGSRNEPEPEALYGKTLRVPIARNLRKAGVRKTTIPGTDVDVYFIEHNDYYDRAGMYNYQGIDYDDNCDRFAFLSRCVLELIKELNLDVDIIHANDWQTAIIPVYLDALYRDRCRRGDSTFDYVMSYADVVRPPMSRAGSGECSDVFNKVKTILTIHNLRHQGRFYREAMERIGLDWSLFTLDKMEFYGQLNFLKSGIVFADALTTVSPKYAEEIQTENYGEKLQGVLKSRSADLYGILNGIDLDTWNPATDKYLPANYDISSYKEGKAKCKEELQRKVGITVNPDVPLLGVVSRFDVQKGLDFIADLASYIVERLQAQIVILGSGDQKLAERLKGLAERYPQSIATLDIFSIELAHQIEAGADIFLMPSRYEPCGLNQMYSLRYGTLPLVHDVGGLHDTVVNASDENIANGTANGFVFYWPTADDMRKALEWALRCFRERKEDWDKIVRQAMSSDLSWGASARKYDKLYRKLLDRRR
ncbi:MAG: glycogen synthase [Thermoguttaceae bacterium]|jgi:starch synthase